MKWAPTSFSLTAVCILLTLEFSLKQKYLCICISLQSVFSSHKSSPWSKSQHSLFSFPTPNPSKLGTSSSELILKGRHTCSFKYCHLSQWKNRLIPLQVNLCYMLIDLIDLIKSNALSGQTLFIRTGTLMHWWILDSPPSPYLQDSSRWQPADTCELKKKGGLGVKRIGPRAISYSFCTESLVKLNSDISPQSTFCLSQKSVSQKWPHYFYPTSPL